eukprot:1353259-Amorphochlora_amoeboformis.AAC.1
MIIHQRNNNNDNTSAKSAAHELHGVNSFYSIFLKHNIDVQVPWQILYDYRGFRNNIQLMRT